MILKTNFPLVASLIAIVIAQVVKIPIAYFTSNKRASLRLAVSTGGMPSSHSAAVSALITALTIQYGFASPYVAIATTFGVIVMFDSMGVRRQSGEQGIALSKIAEEMEKQPHGKQLIFLDPDDESEVTIEQMVIKKYLGHRPTEVFFGVLTGVLSALVTHAILTIL